MIKAVLFDLDETLLVRGEAIKAFLNAQYSRYAEALGKVDLERFRTRFLEIETDSISDKGLVYGRLVDELGVTGVSADELFADYRSEYPNFATLAVGARETLIALRRRGLATGIISNGTTVVQNGKLDATGLRSLADVVLISEAEGQRKPDREIFAQAAARLDLETEECMFVGDNPEVDVVGATDAGMLGVWYDSTTAWPAGLPPAQRAITSLSEILELPELRRPAA